ncbi:type IV secretion system DNA-binding domain-containing protein [Patescibacteria group bacterium]|nr:type IV secretion system DNA-binding domain-containing protein [Patescibacteria group bacterium]
MSFDPERVTFFAQTDARGQNLPFGIKAKDRTRHIYVIGKTGMGKSTMLENMAVQDMQNGEGMAFLDPHGATAEKILEYVPEDRIKDVLYFAPFDMENPISFNVMEDVGPDKRHLVVSGLMSTFKKIWVDAWSGRMEYILSNTLLALLEYPDATLLGVNRMLSDKAYRDAVVANVKDPSVKSFWVDEFAKYNERYMQEAGDAIKNKIGQFTMNPLIRNIIGQPKSSFDVRQMMEDRKILIINLSKGLVGETNANLLGSMFITRIYLAAMSRADMPAAVMAKAPNFYLYVDEFQSFANDTFANILSEARKYKLNLTIAHQYIEQMEEDVRNAVFGNVGTTISFRVGPFDAEVLETVFAPQFTAMDLVNLGFAQIYLTLMIDGIGSRPFSAVTLPPIPKAGVSHVDQVISASRARFSCSRKEVEDTINKWHEPIKKPEKPKATEAVPAIMTDKVVLKSVREGVVPAKAVSPHSSQEKKIDVEVRKVPEPQASRQPEQRSDTKPSAHKNTSGTHGSSSGGQRRPVVSGTDSKQKTSHNLEELRSVLKSLSVVEKKSNPEETKKPELKKSENNSPDALRRALQSVISVDGASAPEKKATQHVLENKPTTEKPDQATSHQSPKHPASASALDTMTPEDLEKMLRVSKHERPPV